MTAALDRALDAFLNFRLAEWSGLPPCLTADVAGSFGSPSEASEAQLGAYPALREAYSAPAFPARGLVVYSRALRVLVIETVTPPPVEVLETLGEPDVCRPQEFRLPGYFVREFLYCRRGLVLGVAEALTPIEPRVKIARCRGIGVLDAPYEYGAEYYMALEDRVLFGSEN